MRSALLLGALACLASGCATVVQGSSESITVNADRDSAFVFVDGVAAGVTPVQLQVRRSWGHRIEVVRDSFRIAHAEITRSFNPVAAAGSFLAGGPGSVIIDAGTGAIFDVDPMRCTSRSCPTRPASTLRPSPTSYAAPSWRPGTGSPRPAPFGGGRLPG